MGVIYIAIMARTKTYYYLIDNMTPDKAVVMKRALQTVSSIHSITMRPSEGIIEVIASRDVEDSIKIACDIAQTIFRIRIKSRKLAR